MEITALLDFLSVSEKLKCATRHCVTTSGRPESVAEHSWRTALMAYLVSDEYPQLDMNKVIKMCLIHDIGEAVTGDIPTFIKTKDDSETESREVSALLRSLPEPFSSEMTALFNEMEALETDEAKLYKCLDKLEALISHNEADISSWLPLEYDLQKTYGVDTCQFSPYTRALRQKVLEDTMEKIELSEIENKEKHFERD